MDLATTGPTKPGMVPAELVIPIKTPAKRGAMSKWLMLKPASENPVEPTATDKRRTAESVSVPK